MWLYKSGRKNGEFDTYFLNHFFSEGDDLITFEVVEEIRDERNWASGYYRQSFLDNMLKTVLICTKFQPHYFESAYEATVNWQNKQQYSPKFPSTWQVKETEQE